MEKYLVVIGKSTIAWKYNPKTQQLVIGGSGWFRRVMHSIITEYIGRDIPKERTVQSNKIKFVLTVNHEAVSKALSQFQEHGFVLKAVKAHGRIMR